MKWPTSLREYHASVAEHEILLSFVNDEDAVRFDEWWQLYGFKQFEAWVDAGAKIDMET